MTTSSRREFIGTGVRAGVAAALVPKAATPERLLRVAERAGGQGNALRVLILGGTGVTGPHLVARAVEAGHEVTLFNRGRTQPLANGELFAHLEQLTGDRAGDLAALRGRSWDVVIDNSGQRVEWTTATAELLRDRVGTYVYTSSTGVYYPYLGDAIGEETPLLREVPAAVTEEEAGEYGYGVMKANSEAAALRVFGQARTLILRPTYIMGPGDRTDRFTYWPVRLARGGEVLVPGKGDEPVQFIDARDVAAFAFRLLEGGVTGTFNVAGPHSRMGMHAFVHGAHAAFNSPVEWVHVPDYDFLVEHRFQYMVPFILPTGNNYGSARIDNRRALEAGLTVRPLAESVADIHAWWTSDAVGPERRERMERGVDGAMAREPRVIAAWRAMG